MDPALGKCHREKLGWGSALTFATFALREAPPGEAPRVPSERGRPECDLLLQSLRHQEILLVSVLTHAQGPRASFGIGLDFSRYLVPQRPGGSCSAFSLGSVLGGDGAGPHLCQGPHGVTPCPLTTQVSQRDPAGQARAQLWGPPGALGTASRPGRHLPLQSVERRGLCALWYC